MAISLLTPASFRKPKREPNYQNHNPHPANQFTPAFHAPVKSPFFIDFSPTGYHKLLSQSRICIDSPSSCDHTNANFVIFCKRCFCNLRIGLGSSGILIPPIQLPKSPPIISKSGCSRRILWPFQLKLQAWFSVVILPGCGKQRWKTVTWKFEPARCLLCLDAARKMFGLWQSWKLPAWPTRVALCKCKLFGMYKEEHWGCWLSADTALASSASYLLLVLSFWSMNLGCEQVWLVGNDEHGKRLAIGRRGLGLRPRAPRHKTPLASSRSLPFCPVHLMHNDEAFPAQLPIVSGLCTASYNQCTLQAVRFPVEQRAKQANNCCLSALSLGIVAVSTPSEYH